MGTIGTPREYQNWNHARSQSLSDSALQGSTTIHEQGPSPVSNLTHNEPLHLHMRGVAVAHDRALALLPSARSLLGEHGFGRSKHSRSECGGGQQNTCHLHCAARSFAFAEDNGSQCTSPSLLEFTSSRRMPSFRWSPRFRHYRRVIQTVRNQDARRELPLPFLSAKSGRLAVVGKSAGRNGDARLPWHSEIYSVLLPGRLDRAKNAVNLIPKTVTMRGTGRGRFGVFQPIPKRRH